MKKTLIILLFSPLLIPITISLGILRIFNKKFYDSINDNDFKESGVY